MDTVDGHSTVEGVMNGVVADVGRVHRADHVEMDGVRSQDEGLTHCEQLNAVDASS